jgi:predicted house-cleaning noncanonical NTP pyrophosphatase (MazG superfamily)
MKRIRINNLIIEVPENSTFQKFYTNLTEDENNVFQQKMQEQIDEFVKRLDEKAIEELMNRPTAEEEE